jgi:hypothetical protein
MREVVKGGEGFVRRAECIQLGTQYFCTMVEGLGAR